MALRKHPRADLRRLAPLLSHLSLALALLVVIGAFHAAPPSGAPVIEPPPPPDWITVDDIVRTVHEPEPPPPPKPPAIVEEVEDDREVPPPDLGDVGPLDVPLAPLGPPPPPVVQPTPPEPEAPPFLVVEEEPQLIGGLAALQRRISYPEAARRARIEGRVMVQFVVDEEGRVRDAVVVRSLGGGLDEEALRAVEAARFTPGKQRGRAVKVQMTLPVTFRLR